MTYRQTKVPNTSPGVKHGTMTAYNHDNCCCDECRTEARRWLGADTFDLETRHSICKRCRALI